MIGQLQNYSLQLKTHAYLLKTRIIQTHTSSTVSVFIHFILYAIIVPLIDQYCAGDSQLKLFWNRSLILFMLDRANVIRIQCTCGMKIWNFVRTCTNVPEPTCKCIYLSYTARTNPPCHSKLTSVPNKLGNDAKTGHFWVGHQ